MIKSVSDDMVTPKKRGTRFEYRVAYLFEKYGYSWDRSRSSMGIDLKITRNGKLRYLISCKKTSKNGPIYIPLEEVSRLEKYSRETRADGMICFGFNRTAIFFLKLKDVALLEKTRQYYKINRGDGHILENMLKKIR
ncbi:MAG: restriction endonuclease [Candidatus Hadarchaeales archaeon]